jgi:hypothetical protein
MERIVSRPMGNSTAEPENSNGDDKPRNSRGKDGNSRSNSQSEMPTSIGGKKSSSDSGVKSNSSGNRQRKDNSSRYRRNSESDRNSGRDGGSRRGGSTGRDGKPGRGEKAGSERDRSSGRDGGSRRGGSTGRDGKPGRGEKAGSERDWNSGRGKSERDTRSRGRDERSDRGGSSSRRDRPRKDGTSRSGGRSQNGEQQRDRHTTPARSETRDRPSFDEDLMRLARQERVLPSEVRTELEAFPPRVTDLVGAAYLLIEDDPAEAYRYLMEAKRAASRSPSVREACGMAAYHSENYDAALKELRTARRLTGRDELVPLIADCERALGNPQKALELASQPLRLTPSDQVELRIVAAGARMDLGQPEAALALLHTPLLDSDEVSMSSARLKYTYAEALLASGDQVAAADWFERAAAADADGDTDADERLAGLRY